MTTQYGSYSFSNAFTTSSIMLVQPHLWIGNPPTCWWCRLCRDRDCCRPDPNECVGSPRPGDHVRRVRHMRRAVVLDVRVP